MKTKAAILVEQKKPLVIDEIEVPALRYGQVLVKIFYSGICGSQLGEIAGAKGPDKFLPHLLGQEASGVVLDTGEGVSQVRKDDMVVLHWMKGKGIDSPAPTYRWSRHGVVNAGWVTTFNELAVVSENRVTRIPASADMETAALFGCALTTGLGAINNNAKVKIGESVAVCGAGGTGLSAILGAALVSAYPIIAIDVSDAKLGAALKLGATHAVNSQMQDMKEEIFRIAGKGGADVVVETTGNVRVIEQAYEATSARGKTILLGVPRGGEKISIYSLPLHFSKVLTGSHGGESDPSSDIPRYLRLFEARKTDLKGMIAERVSLDEINPALERLRKCEITGRCVIKMGA